MSSMPEAGTAPTLEVNGQPWPWHAELTLAALLMERADDAHAVATALNGRFVPRTHRGATALAAGDAVLVFSPIVGG